MSMLVSSRLPPPPAPSTPTSGFGNNTDRSHPTIIRSTKTVPSTPLPKSFNVPFAIQHGYFRCVRYLLQLRFDPNERDSQLRTPLILCAYVENERWGLSLGQNLLEKGAKIALEDHARRNALHHACALQRIHLVQLYLSCVDFNIEAKDCEGNTCLHYVAITGNCEIAELLIRASEKMGVRLDQYVNREGCSAAVLALKYGHIECANQITHRDWDEFFVVPRPLSIYEIPPPKIDHSQPVTTTTIMKKNKKKSHPSSTTTHKDIRPSTLSFGLLKIIFNDCDTGYSTRLADLCHEDKQARRHRRRLRQKQPDAPQTSTATINKFDRRKSIPINEEEYHYSTEALVNEIQSPHTKEGEISLNSSGGGGGGGGGGRTSPRLQLFMQQHILDSTTNKLSPKESTSTIIRRTISKPLLSTDETLIYSDISKIKSTTSSKAKTSDDNEEIKSKTSIPTIYRQTSHSTINQSDQNGSLTYESLNVKMKSPRPKTAVLTRNQLSRNAVGAPSRLSSGRPQPQPPPPAPALNHKKTKKKAPIVHRPDSAPMGPKPAQAHSTVVSDISTYSQTLYAGRPLSAMIQHHHAPHPAPRSSDSTCSIREATGPTCRYNKPEELFGLRPQDLFGPQQQQQPPPQQQEQHQPKILDHRPPATFNDKNRLKRNALQRQHFCWQQDVDKIIELYNIHHSANYRSPAVPPPPPPPLSTLPGDAGADLTQTAGARARRASISKGTLSLLKPPTNPKQSTFASLNMGRRNSITRPTIKMTNA